MKSKYTAKENIDSVSKKMLTTVESRKSESKLKRRTSAGTPHLATATRRPKQSFDQNKEEESSTYATTPRITYRD